MLYWYLYMWIFIDHKIDQFHDYRANLKWIKKHGPYEG